MIEYHHGSDLDLDQVIDLYRSCSLGERRPVERRDIMAGMLQHGNLTITAWDEDLMVGIARSFSDFGYVTYLADLAVRESHQKRGIGRELIRLTREAGGPTTTIVLLAAPQAADYYPRIGFEQHPRAWWLPANAELR